MFEQLPIPQTMVPWLKFGLSLIMSLMLLGALARFTLHHAARIAARTASRLDDILIENSRAPVRVLVAYLSLLIAVSFLPENLAGHKATKLIQQAAFIVLLAWIVTRLLKAWLLRPGQLGPMGGRKLLFRITQIAIFILTGVMMLDAFGVSITPLLASLGIGSMAIALALQDTLGNLFAGFYLQIDEPIREGDFVRLDDGTEGTVEQIGWRSTKLRLLTDNIVVIPNSKLTGSQILNYDLVKSETAVYVPGGVSYKEDLAKVEQVILDVAKQIQASVEDAVPEFEPRVRFRNFGDSAIEFNVVLRAKNIGGQFLLRHEFIKALHSRFRLEGIEIPFPQRVVELKGPTPQGPL